MTHHINRSTHPYDSVGAVPLELHAKEKAWWCRAAVAIGLATYPTPTNTTNLASKRDLQSQIMQRKTSRFFGFLSLMIGCQAWKSGSRPITILKQRGRVKIKSSNMDCMRDYLIQAEGCQFFT
jgi:hypothetical protein